LGKGTDKIIDNRGVVSSSQFSSIGVKCFVAVESREINGDSTRSLDRIVVGSGDILTVTPNAAAHFCGDNKMIGSSLAIVPHPFGSGPLLSEGTPDNGPTENPGWRSAIGKHGTALNPT
jgi:hypothetical protein